MPNKGNYVNLAFAAMQHANDLAKLEERLRNATPAQLAAAERFWKGKIQNEGANIHRRMNRLGLEVRNRRIGTVNYYTTLANLALARTRD